jgi:hypothetical protein
MARARVNRVRLHLGAGEKDAGSDGSSRGSAEQRSTRQAGARDVDRRIGVELGSGRCGHQGS